MTRRFRSRGSGKKGKKMMSRLKEMKLNKIITPQWGIPIILYLLAIIVMTSHFGFVTLREAENDVQKDLIQGCQMSMLEFENTINEAKFSAKSVAKVIGDHNLGKDELIRHAELLQNAQDTTYMVAIADSEGKAYTSIREEKNVKDAPYFSKRGGVECYIVEDDGITGDSAVVVAVPYHTNMIRKGTIYMYISREKVEQVLTLKQGLGLTSYVFCDNEGKLLLSGGENSVFTQNGQYIENFEGAEITDSNVARISSQLESKNPYVFEAKKDREDSFFVTVPAGIHNWRFVGIMDEEQRESMIAKERKSSQGIINGIGLSLFGFIIIVMILGTFDKMKEREQREHLTQRADTDLLTGLNNKIATERKVQEYIDRHPDTQSVFFLFDIDNFKKINDTQGHAFGDQVLRSLGNQITNEFRISDIIGRTGGDEFIIFLKGIQTEEQIQKEVEKLERFFKHFQVGEYVKYSATASIGISIYPQDATSYAELYKLADIALYEAKNRGKNQYVYYHNDMHEPDDFMKKDKKIDSDI